MICPGCKTEQTVCIDTRQRQDFRRRRYKCLACGERFSTRETMSGPLIKRTWWKWTLEECAEHCKNWAEQGKDCGSCPLHDRENHDICMFGEAPCNLVFEEG